MTEIGLIRNNKKKKTNKISWISYFFPTHFLVHRKVRCPPKLSPQRTSILVYIYIYTIIPVATLPDSSPPLRCGGGRRTACMSDAAVLLTKKNNQNGLIR